MASSFHWVDRQGFHSVDQLSQVPLEHRRDLPMALNGTSFPFTEQEDHDGAMYVWFILGQSGYDYHYSILPLVFAHLLRDGRVTEDDLQGLGQKSST